MDIIVWFWIIAFIVFVLIEAMTPQFITIWFGVGALGGVIAALLNLDLRAQALTFIVISTILLLSTRKLANKLLKNKSIKTNADRIIGTIAIVIEEINNDLATGSVKASGQFWTARTIDNSIISIGEKVVVQHIDGVKLIVSKQKKSKEEI